MLNNILKKDYIALKEEVHSKMDEISKYVIECIRNQYEEFMLEDVQVSENVILETRFKIVNRVRGGKIQRRKRISNVKGYRFQDNRLVRMSPQERMKRIRGQRKAKIKRKAKLGRSLQRRKISIRRRGNL